MQSAPQSRNFLKQHSLENDQEKDLKKVQNRSEILQLGNYKNPNIMQQEYVYMINNNQLSKDIEKACIMCNGNTVDPIKYATYCILLLLFIFTFTVIGSILELLGMFSQKSTSKLLIDSTEIWKERSLVIKLWGILNKKDDDGIKLRNLKTAIMAIIDCDYNSKEDNFNEKSLGKYDGDIYVVTESEAINLHKLFGSLKKTNKESHLLKSNAPNIPTINACSAIMAEKYRGSNNEF